MDGASTETRVSFRNDSETVTGFVLPIPIECEEAQSPSILTATLPPECLEIWYGGEVINPLHEIGGELADDLWRRTIELLRDE